jgi:hypothetical protein
MAIALRGAILLGVVPRCAQAPRDLADPQLLDAMPASDLAYRFHA